MNGYEQLALLLRAEQKEKKTVLKGVMTSGTSCKVGDIEYKDDDLIVPTSYKKPICTKVSFVDGVDNSKYLLPLKKGDTVFLYPMSETEFLIVGRL